MIRSPLKIGPKAPDVQSIVFGFHEIPKIVAELQALKEKMHAEHTQTLIHMDAAFAEKMAEADKTIEQALTHAYTLRQGAPGLSIKGDKGDTPNSKEVAKELLPLLTPHLPQPAPVNHDKIAQLVLAKLPPPTPIEIPTVDEDAVVQKVFGIIEKKGLKVKHIDGLEQTISSFSSQLMNKGGYVHGGGDTVAAGSGVTIVNMNGTKVISASGAGLTIIAVTGTIDDSNLTFASTTEPTLLNINGAFYKKTGGAYTWSWAATVITLNNPVGTGGSIFGI